MTLRNLYARGHDPVAIERDLLSLRSAVVKLFGLTEGRSLINNEVQEVFNDDMQITRIKNVGGTVVALTAGTIPVATGERQVADVTAAAAITPLNEAYVTPELDTEAEIIAAFNTTNAAVNEIIVALQNLGILA